jgi:hypothetical protein
MKRYAVSIVWQENLNAGSINIGHSLWINSADSEDEAFGLAFLGAAEMNKTHVVMQKIVAEI